MKVCGILLAALLLIGISFAHSGTEADLNRIPKNTCKIVGGQEASPGAWPWMTALIHSYEDSLYDAHFCGGTLIHPKWVVTAAHCVDDKRTEDIEVVAGIHDLAHDTEKRIKVRRIISHPAYDYWTDDSDIALLELEENALQETIPLVSEGSVLTGKDAVTMGRGDTGAYESPEKLQEVTVRIVSNETCLESYGEGMITDNMICAGYSERTA